MGRWEIGISGTFDVANYGDLLFPLIAEAELTKRLGEITLHRFSYQGRTSPEWPYEVTSLTELPGMIHRLDALLIGGGFLIRFDKDVAPEYVPPAPEIHHPTGYWLTPALIALQHDVPVVWNAPGTDGNDIPTWAKPLMETVLGLSRYVSVRDQPSRCALQPLTSAPVAVVPDTAFGLRRLLNLDGPPSTEFTRLCDASGLRSPYIVVQAKPGLEGFVRFLRNHPELLRSFQFLALPIGPGLGDRDEVIDADLQGVVRLDHWPSPLVLSELIGRAEAVVGQSYHLCIAARVSGVPVFVRHNLPSCKYSVLEDPKAFFALPPNGEPDIEWFLARVGRQTPSSSECAMCKPLGEHWDKIAAAIRAERVPTAPALSRFWQSLPTLLEDGATREREAFAASAQERTEIQRMQEALATTRGNAAETQHRLDEALGQLAVKQEQSATLQDRLEKTREQLAIAQQQTAERQDRLDKTLGQLAVVQQQAAVTLDRLDETVGQLAVAQREAADRQDRLDDMARQVAAAHHESAERQARSDHIVRQLTVARAEAATRDSRIEEIQASISWRVTAPLRFVGRQMRNHRTRQLINSEYIRRHRLETDPYEWAAINNLFNEDDAAKLAATYPCDHFKLMAVYDGEKQHQYEVRALIGMGADVIAYPDDLSEAWRALALDLLSPEYRAAMTTLTGCDLMKAPVEVNVFHYGPGGVLGPHRDLPEKLVTHVLYFNRSWNGANGGCLKILRSSDPADVVAEIPPVVGYSSVIVRSDNSWHAVSPVASEAACSRRSVNVTFYRPGAVSTMWPPNDATPLHSYHAADLT